MATDLAKEGAQNEPISNWLFILLGLNPKNLVRSDFYLTNFYQLIDETFWEEGKHAPKARA